MSETATEFVERLTKAWADHCPIHEGDIPSLLALARRGAEVQHLWPGGAYKVPLVQSGDGLDLPHQQESRNMSNIVGTFRSYAHDKDNMPRMDTEVVYVRVKHLLEAAARIEQLEAELRRIHSVTNKLDRSPAEDREALWEIHGIARAALEDKS